MIAIICSPSKCKLRHISCTYNHTTIFICKIHKYLCTLSCLTIFKCYIMNILALTPKAAAEPLAKLVKSAAANAENNHGMDPEKLYVSEVFATPGPIIKRIMPRAQGRAYRINKRTSHVTLAVAEKE